MKKGKPTNPLNVPLHESEEDEVRFWKSQELTEQYLSRAEAPPEEELPPRSKPISVRFGEDIVRRLKALARKRDKGYQTLLKEFVVERLREEEAGVALSSMSTLISAYQRQNDEMSTQLTSYATLIRQQESVLREQERSLQVQAQQLHRYQEQLDARVSRAHVAAVQAATAADVYVSTPQETRLLAEAEATQDSVLHAALRTMREKVSSGSQLIGHS